MARVHGYPPVTNAGAEWMLHPLLAALVSRGHDAEVHLTRPVPRDCPWTLDGVIVLPFGAWHPWPRPDVFVTHLESTRETADAARGYGMPLIVLQHNTFRLALDDLALAAPSLLVVNSEWMAAKIAHPGRTAIVRPPVDPAAYETTPGDLVTLISMTHGKGGTLLWEVARRMPGTEFLAVQGSYGIQVEGDLPNVTVLPTMDGRAMRDEVYARTRILLVPSDYESWGRVATEAMCSGIPVIANRAEGGLAENLGNAAIWADRDDPDSWVAQIRRLQKAAAWEKASEACRKRAAELDPTADLERWCQAIEALAA